MSEAKNGVVLTCEKGGNVFLVSADSFSRVDFNGVTIQDGVQYYIDKAVSSGATIESVVKPKVTRKKTTKK
tara:strand:+ start:293 stop:505 length:213 start_codon:yes stop_codon:yes gene_type:complete